MIGLTSCASHRDAPPPLIHETTVIKRVSLPAECFDHVPTVVVGRGDTNEDVAYAYRDNLGETILGNERLDLCFEKNGALVEEGD